MVPQRGVRLPTSLVPGYGNTNRRAGARRAPLLGLPTGVRRAPATPSSSGGGLLGRTTKPGLETAAGRRSHVLSHEHPNRSFPRKREPSLVCPRVDSRVRNEREGVAGEVAGQFSRRVMQAFWRTGRHPTLSAVIVGFNPTIHAMTVQKHCPQTRPFAAQCHATENRAEPPPEGGEARKTG
jgi:hypothetical protein